MSWQIIVIILLGGFLILFPLFTFISSHRMIGKRVHDDRFEGEDRLLYFYNESCTPCRYMTPIIDQLTARHGNVYKVDVSQYPDTARKYGISATPTIVLVKEHVVKEVAIGMKTQKQLERMLREIS